MHHELPSNPEPVWILNNALQVKPTAHGRFSLSLFLWQRHCEATRYELGVLLAFTDGATQSAVFREYPYHRAATEIFLHQMIELGFLLPAHLDEKGIYRTTTWPLLMSANPTFCHSPQWHDVKEQAHAVIIGIPWDRDVTGKSGARMGPWAVRSATHEMHFQLDPILLHPMGFHDYYLGHTILEHILFADAGDVFNSPGEPSLQSRQRMTDAAAQITASGALPIFIGGDHSVTYPLLKGVLQALRVGFHDDADSDTENDIQQDISIETSCIAVNIVHFDAHTDLGDLALDATASDTGLHHGNVMTAILNELPEVKKIIQIGLRGIVEKSIHENVDRVIQIPMSSVHQQREQVLAEILSHLDVNIPCYLSLDIDVLDPAFAPSTGTPVCSGMSPADLWYLVRELAKARTFIGGDVVEVGEMLHGADTTASIAAYTILYFIDGVLHPPAC